MNPGRGLSQRGKYDRFLPMLSVTVMMLRDMVESVMLLNEDDCRTQNVTVQRINKPDSLEF